MVCGTYLSGYRGDCGKSVRVVSHVSGGDTFVRDNISGTGMFLSADIPAGAKKRRKGRGSALFFRRMAYGVSFISSLYVELWN